MIGQTNEKISPIDEAFASIAFSCFSAEQRAAIKPVFEKIANDMVELAGLANKQSKVINDMALVMEANGMDMDILAKKEAEAVKVAEAKAEAEIKASADAALAKLKEDIRNEILAEQKADADAKAAEEAKAKLKQEVLAEMEAEAKAGK